MYQGYTRRVFVDSYKVGDTVVWENEERPSPFDKEGTDIGEGPFTVHSTRRLGMGPLSKEYVQISTPDGKVVCDPESDEPIEFYTSWFKKTQ